MESLLLYSSSGILGIFLGAQLAEAKLLVPYWQSLPAPAFFSYYKKFGPSIKKFFTPLTIAATLLPIVAAVYTFSIHSAARSFALSTAILAILFFSSFFLYFKKANQHFTDADLSEDQLKTELNKWKKWHRARVLIEAIAFVCSLMAIAQI